MNDERTHIYEIVENHANPSEERIVVWWNAKRKRTESNDPVFLKMLHREHWVIGVDTMIDEGPEYLDALPMVFKSGYLLAKRVG
jgi:hypothetical protein